MSKLTQRARNLFLVLVAALGIGGFAFLLPSALRAAYAVEGGVPALQAESADKAGDESLTVLAFTSDVHNKYNGNVAATRNGTWLNKMKTLYGDDIDAMAFGGDMGDASDGTNFWTNSQKVMDAVSGAGVVGVYTTGNHEYNPGSYSASSTNTTQQAYKINTVGKVGENYIIYCLGSVSESQSYASQVGSLRDYLNSVGTDKPIFIITHFPLHYTKGRYFNRTTADASRIIDVLNDAVDDGKTIIYLWGHNHTEAPTETHYDQIFAPDDSLQYTSSASNTANIKFYYAAAGCMSGSEYSGNGVGSDAVEGKGLIVTINSKKQLSFAYYDENGNNVTENGTNGPGTAFTEQDPVAIDSATIDEAGTNLTVEAGRTLPLHYTVSPVGATVKSVTWSSSDESVATVDNTGKVKGVNPGTATITVTISDGMTRGQVYASVNVEVTERTSSDPEYVIVIDGYALSTEVSPNTFSQYNGYNYKGLSGVAYSEDDIAGETIRWTITEAEGGGYYIQSTDGRYLSASYPNTSTVRGQLDLSDTPDVWTISGDLDSWMLNGSTLTSTNASRSLVYEAGSTSSPANLFTVRSTGETSHLYEASDPIAVTGVTVTPKAAEVEARKTIQLTATVAPSNATNKNVTWTSSDTTVATVDGNGKVKGIAEGTATITATTDDGGKTATCVVNVVPNDSPQQAYVIAIDGYALSIERSPNTAQGGSTGYSYRGLAGVAYESGAAADDSIRWIVEPTDGGYYIMSVDGRYLNATYDAGNNTGHGDLVLSGTPDVWVLDDGYSFGDGPINGSYLKSTNATASTPDKPKYLGYENEQNLFTVRSHDNADAITVEEAVDPIAVTGITVDPTEVTVQQRGTAQLTATVLPENASNKNVTWTSSAESIATVDENGLVRGIAGGTATITATTVDGGKTATCDVTVTPDENPQQTYVITVGNSALSVERSESHANGTGGSTSYVYTGLAAVEFDPADVAGNNIRWILEETDGGYYIRSLDGRYLNATYTAVSNPSASNPTRGDLKLDDTPDIWVLDGTLDSWEVDGSLLKSTNASATSTSAKYLAYEDRPADLFTVRSEENADETTIVDPENPIVVETRYDEVTSLEDGGEFIVAVNESSDGSSVYALVNRNNNIASETLPVESEGDGAFIVTDNTSVVWTYTASNQYLANNGRYLSRSTSGSTSGLTTSTSSGYPVAYTQDHALTLHRSTSSNTYYLTLNGSSFSSSTSASSAAQVRLFQKKTHVLYTIKWVDGDGNVLLVDQLEKGAMPAFGGDTPTKAEDEQYTYTFTGWSPEVVAVTGSATYTAQFEAVPKTSTTYTVTFETDGGSSIDAQTVAEGGKATRPETDPSKEGCFAFDDWYADGACTSLFDFDAEITADTTAYAKWNDAHTLTAVAAKEPTCTEPGAIEYWTCSRCGGRFADEAGAEAVEDVTVEALGHDLVHHDAQAPTCTAAGWYAYDTCSRCDYTTYAEIPATGHDWEFKGFTWTGSDTDGYTAATANYACKNNQSHTETVDAEVTTGVTAPTCTEDGKTTYTASVSVDKSLDGTARAVTKEVAILATGHSPVTDPAVAATCTEKGLTEGSHCSVCNEVLVAQEDVPALGHDWEFVEFTWTGSDADGYTAATANYVCKRDSEHTTTADAELGSVVTDPTCTEGGKTTYTATVAESDSPDGVAHYEAKEGRPTEATGHAWGEVTYEWAEDGSECTATRTCVNDATHVESEKANITTEVTKEATCEGTGETTYTATFESAAFETQTKTLEDVPALGHDWGEWELTTPASCTEAGTETRTCSRDAGHVETHTVEALGHDLVHHDSQAATCTEAGWDAYDTCGRCDYTTYAEVPALGHTPGEPQRENEIPATCTAEGSYNEVVYCTVCEATLSSTPKTIEKLPHEPADPIVENNIAATCETDGSYDSVVKCSVCSTELSRETMTVPALGHEWGGWEVTTPATCTEAGTETRTCSRDASHTETRAVEALGHDYRAPEYTWVKAEEGDDYVKVTAVMICNNDKSHVIYDEVDITDDMIRIDPEPTADKPGKKIYTVPFNNPVFEEQVKEVTIPPVGYIYGEPEYVWEKDENDNWTCTATAKCLNAPDADIVEEGIVTSSVTTDPTCTEQGEITYRADFNNERFVQQAMTEPVAMIDHAPAAAITQNVIAATCTDEGSYDSVVKCSACGFELSRETVTVPALGHAWTGQTYTWSDDYTTATATATCSHDESHILKETVNTTNTVVPPSCVADGTITYSAKFEQDAFSAQSTTVVGDPATGHAWGEVTYTWDADNSTVTASRSCSVCDANETEMASTTPEVTKPATCEGTGETTYTATFKNAAFETQTKAVETPATGHAWGGVTYAWADDGSGCTATRVCANDETHTETGTADITSEVTKQPTCEAAGETTYTATFENAAFETQTRTVEDIPALSHDWGEWEVTTPATCTEAGTATRTCSRDASHVETRLIEAAGHDLTAVAAKEPTCTEAGYEAHWACSACGGLFADEAGADEIGAPVAIPALGHSMARTDAVPATCTEAGAVEYWTCSRCGGRFADEAGDEAVEDVAVAALGHDLVHHDAQAPTCTEAGWDAYDTCSRCDYTTYVEIPATGHDYALAGWTWAADNSSASATFTCANEATHTETVEATVTATATAAACETGGEVTYVAAVVFEDKGYSNEKVVTVAALGHDLVHHDAKAATCTEDGWDAYDTCSRCDYTTYAEIPATGHAWGEATYTWSKGNKSVTAERTCANDPSHVETETVDATSKVTKATCEAKGKTAYTATFKNEAFSAQTKIVEIPATGHAWGEAAYTWSKDNKTVTAERTCANDASHVETEKVSTNAKVSTKATCEAKGKTTYTATFENEAFSTQTKKVADIAALGHSYKLSGWTWKEDAKGYMKATAKFVCTRDSAHTVNKTVTAAYKVKAATGAKSGTIVYTATIKAADSPTGKAVTAKKTVVVAPTLLTVKVSGSTMKLTWAKNSMASKYKVYYGECGVKSKVYKTVGPSTTSLNISKLANGSHKAVIVTQRLINNKLVKVSTSAGVHVKVGTSGSYRNATAVKLKSSSSVTLAKGNASQVEATVSTTSGKKLFYKGHTEKLRYATSDSTVATVSSSGKITAKGKGTCKVYVIAPNGIRKAITVTVK